MKKVLMSSLGIVLVMFFVITQAQGQRANESEVRELLDQLSVKLDDLKYNIDYELRRKRIARSEEGRLLDSFRALQRELSGFQEKFSRRWDSQYELTNLLSRAKSFDEDLSRVRLGFAVQGDWASAKDLFSRLADVYGVSWDWRMGQTGGRSFAMSLTGTYSLNLSRSDDVSLVADRAVRNADVQNKDAARRDLETLLEPPQRLTIEIRGNRVTLESSLAQQITLIADDKERTETLSDGRMIRLRTSLQGQEELTIRSFGEDNDYRVTFSLIDGGRGLRVTRSVTLDYLGQAVSAESFYVKTDSVARFGIYGNDSNRSSLKNGRDKRFIIPNGTVVTGTLENDISTKTSRNYDKFTLTVVAPTSFRGSVIEGYISGVSRSGRVSGRPQITFNFETIRMPSGEVYDFRGVLMSVTDMEGKTIKIDPEGSVKGESQTKETLKRGAIGSALGALVGAIAGGAKGAAIGAIIGGSAGAGSVVVQGKDDLELKAGSTIMVRSSAPTSQR